MKDPIYIKIPRAAYEDVADELSGSGFEHEVVHWQELTDRPPSRRVLVCTKFGEVTAGTYAAGMWWRDGDKPIHAEVTHWMPLPDAPENRE